MYKENNFDLKLPQYFYRQKAVPPFLWDHKTIQSRRGTFGKCPGGTDCKTALGNLCQGVAVLIGKTFLPMSTLDFFHDKAEK